MNNLDQQKRPSTEAALHRAQSVLFLGIILLVASCCPCYFSNSAETTGGVKSQLDILFAAATDDYPNHQEEIKTTSAAIDDAISQNAKRNGCKPVANLWSSIKNPEGKGVYDQFITTWEGSTKLESITISSVKSSVFTILDNISKTEDDIKQDGKEACNY